MVVSQPASNILLPYQQDLQWMEMVFLFLSGYSIEFNNLDRVLHRLNTPNCIYFELRPTFSADRQTCDWSEAKHAKKSQGIGTKQLFKLSLIFP